MPEALKDEVRRLVQEFLSTRDEERCWLYRSGTAEWNAAYRRILEYVCRKMQRGMDWREFLKRREAVIQCVRAVCELERSR